MAPRTEQNPNAAANNGGVNLSWVVGNNPQELKSKKNMATVRKAAMRSYLDHDKKNDKKTRETRLLSEGSTGSMLSVGNQDTSITVSGEEWTNSNTAEGAQGSAPRSGESRRSKNPSSLESHQLSSQQTHERVLDTALIVAPPRTSDRGLPLPYEREQTPLFVSFGEGIDPFKTMFQSSYPRVSVERMKFLCARFFGTYAMGQHWIPTVLSAPHTFLSTLCCASAHLDAIFERDIESVETSLLRQEVIHLVSQNIVHPGKEVDDLNITALTQLVVSEAIGREEISLKINESGLETMVRLRGGLNMLGMSGYLASTISWVLLESAILREERPQDIFSDYCTARSTKKYPITATIPESPLYRPRPQFETLKRSRYYRKETIELLDDVQAMIELFLRPTKSTRRDSRTLLSLYRDITTKYPPISKGQDTTQDDYKYEAIRITAVLQATAIMECIPLSEALPHAATALFRTPHTFPAFSRSMNSPTSPLSPMNLRHDSFLDPSTISSYASSLTSQPPSSYFDAARSSISSVTTSHPSISSTTSHPSISSIATSHSSISSTEASRPSIHLSNSRQSLPTNPTSSYNCNPFADYTVAPKQTPSTTLLLTLKTVLDASNMSECWQDMAGVLLWIGLTVGAASHKNGNRVLEKWYSALSMRASVLLCFEHPEPIHATMLTMGRLIEALREPDVSGTADATRALLRRDSAAPGKKMKV